MHPEPKANRRILLIDDNPAIHDDFRKSLAPRSTAAIATLVDLEAELFGDTEPVPCESTVVFEITSAYQGAEGAQLVRQAIAVGRPFALAFVDIRMPPGWDGVETIGHLWSVDPD